MTELKRGRKPLQLEDGKTNQTRWLAKHQLKTISIKIETYQQIADHAVKHNLSLANALNELLNLKEEQ
jgi:hypothetical protein